MAAQERPTSLRQTACDYWIAAVALWLASISLTVVSPTACGADLERQPSQLTIRHWTLSDGLPAEFIWSLHQTKSGYLWLATDTGIARFDGLNFKTYSVATHDALRSNDIRELTGGANDTIWAGKRRRRSGASAR
ncbi:MAG: two-component regulator propeller domain-containing protein [Gammaproteobacteria bacterium]